MTHSLEISLDAGFEQSLQKAVVSGRVADLALLLDQGVSVHQINNQGKSLLHRAASFGYAAMIRLLIDRGADIDVSDDCLATPLHIAADTGDLDTVQVFLDHQADIEACDKFQQTPLHRAAWAGHTAVVELLLKRGATIDAIDDHGLTPLIGASYWGRVSTLQLLLDAGADIEARSSPGHTALHRAICAGQVESVMILIERGADREARASQKTPLQLALERLDLISVQVLLAMGVRADDSWKASLPSDGCSSVVADEMGRVMRLDRLEAAVAMRRTDLLGRCIGWAQQELTSKEMEEQLRAAMRYANDRHCCEAAAFLQSVLASRAIETATTSDWVVKPL